MTPSEVIAMRNLLARELGSVPPRQEDMEMADHLIETGWVTSMPEGREE